MTKFTRRNDERWIWKKNEKKFLLKMQKIIRRIRCKISQRNSVINDTLLYKFNLRVNKVITPCMNILLTSKNSNKSRTHFLFIRLVSYNYQKSNEIPFMQCVSFVSLKIGPMQCVDFWQGPFQGIHSSKILVSWPASFLLLYIFCPEEFLQYDIE